MARTRSRSLSILPTLRLPEKTVSFLLRRIEEEKTRHVK